MNHGKCAKIKQSCVYTKMVGKALGYRVITDQYYLHRHLAMNVKTTSQTRFLKNLNMRPFFPSLFLCLSFFFFRFALYFPSSSSCVFRFTTPDCLDLEVRMVLTRANLPTEMRNVHQNLFSRPTGNDIGNKKDISLDVGLESCLAPNSYFLELLILRPAADRSLGVLGVVSALLLL